MTFDLTREQMREIAQRITPRDLVDQMLAGTITASEHEFLEGCRRLASNPHLARCGMTIEDVMFLIPGYPASALVRAQGRQIIEAGQKLLQIGKGL